jgi:hypothetical protein
MPERDGMPQTALQSIAETGTLENGDLMDVDPDLIRKRGKKRASYAFLGYNAACGKQIQTEGAGISHGPGADSSERDLGQIPG